MEESALCEHLYLVSCAPDPNGHERPLGTRVGVCCLGCGSVMAIIPEDRTVARVGPEDGPLWAVPASALDTVRTELVEAAALTASPAAARHITAALAALDVAGNEKRAGAASPAGE